METQTGEKITATSTVCRWEFTVDTRMMDMNRVLRADWLLGLNQQSGEHLFKCVGLGNEMLEKQGIATVYTRIRLLFDRPVMVDEKLTLTTAMSFRRGPIMKRDLDLFDENGEHAGGVYTEAVAMDVDTRSIMRGERCAVFDIVPCPENSRGALMPRFRLPQVMEEVGSFTIGYADIDFNGHMNNTKYINFVLGFADGGMKGRYLKEADMEYHAECRGGETLTVRRGTDGDGQVITFSGADGTERFRAKIMLGDIE